MKARVLHVLEAAQFGTIRHLADIVRHVDAAHTVILPPDGCGRTNDHRVIDEMQNAGARIHLVNMRRSATARRNVAVVRLVRRIIGDERPDIVHGHSSIGGVIARLAALGTGAARCYTPNGLFPSRLAFAIERALGRITHHFIAASASEAEFVRRHRLVRSDRVSVIPNAIDLDLPPALDIREQLGIDASTPLVGTVGRLVHQKAPEVYVRACAQVAASNRTAHFVIIGDGPLADMVASEVQAAGLDGRFHVVRMLSGGAAAVPQFDVFAMSSRYEGGAYAPMEAMRAGVPVILTDVVGNRDTIVDGQSGLLVPPDDPRALATAMLRLVEDAELRRSIGTAGRARVAENFDVHKMAARLGALYRTLTSRVPVPVELRAVRLSE